MLRLTSDDSGASQLIGYVYTALISVLILSSMMLTSSTMLNGSVSNTVQEEAEQLALYFQLAVEDLLNTVREYPTGGKNPKFKLYVKMANGFFHEKLIRNLIALSSLRVDVEQTADLEKVNLVIDGEISSDDILIISKNMIENSEDLIFFGTKWSDGMLGIIELIIIIHIADLLHQRSI